MPHEKANHETTFGYLTTIESEEHGYFGGYLVLSPMGRPLEFHCTAPVKPSRAQLILYGPTLEPYLLGEQIATALLGVARLRPQLILTNHEVLFHASERSEVPIGLLTGGTSTGLVIADETPHDTETACASTACGTCSLACVTGNNRDEITVGDYQVRLPSGRKLDRAVLTTALTQFAERVDLAEPFERIREAIGEAQRIGGRNTDAHDQAA